MLVPYIFLFLTAYIIPLSYATWVNFSIPAKQILCVVSLICTKSYSHSKIVIVLRNVHFPLKTTYV